MINECWNAMKLVSICVWNINGVLNKFHSVDVSNLLSSNELVIINETHFGIRSKTPESYTLVARSSTRESKKLRGGVAVYRKINSTLKLNILSDNLYDMVVIGIENTSAIIIALYIPPSNTIYYSDLYFENLSLVIASFQQSKDIYIFGDLNTRVGNNFPKNNYSYKLNPDITCNKNGRNLMDILNQHKNLAIVNGIIYKNRIIDSKFTCIRSAGSSQVDLAITNNIDSIHSFSIKNKLPQSDHCPIIINMSLKMNSPIISISDCACGFDDYSHYDISKKIKRVVDIKKLNLISLEHDLHILGTSTLNKYKNMHSSQERIDEFTNDITNGIYRCCLKNYIAPNNPRRVPTQKNCNANNFQAIAEAHLKRYIDLTDTNIILADHHKEEWLFYQSISWQKEQEELNRYRTERWGLIHKKDPKKLWKLLDWKGEIKNKVSCPPNVIHSYFNDNIFNSSKKNNPILKSIKIDVIAYQNRLEITDKEIQYKDTKAGLRRTSGLISQAKYVYPAGEPYIFRDS